VKNSCILLYRLDGHFHCLTVDGHVPLHHRPEISSTKCGSFICIDTQYFKA
jgi:hypothetical protein